MPGWMSVDIVISALLFIAPFLAYMYMLFCRANHRPVVSGKDLKKINKYGNMPLDSGLAMEEYDIFCYSRTEEDPMLLAGIQSAGSIKELMDIIKGCQELVGRENQAVLDKVNKFSGNMYYDNWRLLYKIAEENGELYRLAASKLGVA